MNLSSINRVCLPCLQFCFFFLSFLSQSWSITVKLANNLPLGVVCDDALQLWYNAFHLRPILYESVGDAQALLKRFKKVESMALKKMSQFPKDTEMPGSTKMSDTYIKRNYLLFYGYLDSTKLQNMECVEAAVMKYMLSEKKVEDHNVIYDCLYSPKFLEDGSPVSGVDVSKAKRSHPPTPESSEKLKPRTKRGLFVGSIEDGTKDSSFYGRTGTVTSAYNLREVPRRELEDDDFVVVEEEEGTEVDEVPGYTELLRALDASDARPKAFLRELSLSWTFLVEKGLSFAFS